MVADRFRRALHLLSAAALLAACALPPAADGAEGTSIPLNNAAWAFAPDRSDTGIKRGWANGSFSGRPVQLPHVTDASTTDSSYRGSIGWYRVRLNVPRPAPGNTWELDFEQVRRVADVWIDGRKVGRHTGSYEPFTMPARPLTGDRPHTIVIRADNRLQTGRRPDGWWNWGGITRAVTLRQRGALVLTETGTLPQRICNPGCRWQVLVDTTLTNRGDRTLRPVVAASLSAPDAQAGGNARAVTRPLAPGETARVRFKVPVKGDPKLWSPGNPALYGARVTASAAGAAGSAPVETTRVGLRSVEVIDGVIYLNDNPIELRGASIHEDTPDRGAALSDADITRIVDQLKAVGANVTRAHYALDQRLLDRLSEQGIMFWAQAPVYHRDNELDTAAGRREMLRVARSAVLQTRNHAATITHSVANELSTHPDDRAGTRSYLNQSRRMTADLNPTLPVSVDVLSYPGLERQNTYAAFPLIGVNTYFGWYKGRKGHSTADLKTLVPFVKEMRSWYPKTALVMTEFGAEATVRGAASEKQTFAFQKSYIEETLALADRLPALSGAIYWTLQEFAVKPEWDGGARPDRADQGPIHHKGVVTLDGQRKPGWEALREGLTASPVERSAREVELATGIPQPRAERGRLGITATIAIVLAVLAVLLMDLLALIVWRRHAHEDEDELIEAMLAADVPALTLVEDEDRDARVA